MILRFFKLPKHRSFNYKPRYYDPIKDEVQERVKLIEQEMNADKESYVPGSSIRGNMKRQFQSSRKDVKKNKMQTLIIRLVLMIIIFLVLYFIQKYL
ncbi:hypothetical protein [Acetobacteroides hydrogenigenes]|uniref:Uncharacterized protein n=1 Tax=Acetobacteroides hydrogenigenes TaxID=979970 RepID=A0A4R2EVL3_9BACT|nr:hypothetical protein [Acetobacteroides hydrogenigenes]TCN73204.1 hypothetical protein CLV25_101425 [Acetobacteroides hydrogenigenes]